MKNNQNQIPRVLIPFDKREAISLTEAARIAGRTPETIRSWAALYDLGRRVGGRWVVSRIGLAMFLDSDQAALRAYLAGDRTGPLVAAYFARAGIMARAE